MAKLIVDGARMHCTMGTAEAKIGVTSHAFVKVGGALVATEADKEAMGNIPPFGTCKCGWPNPPCIPKPQGWQQTAQGGSVNGARKLTDASFCPCLKGGCISFCDVGKGAFVEIE